MHEWPLDGREWNVIRVGASNSRCSQALMGMLKLLAKSPATLSEAAASGAASFLDSEMAAAVVLLQARRLSAMLAWAGLDSFSACIRARARPPCPGNHGVRVSAWRDASPGCSEARRAAWRCISPTPHKHSMIFRVKGAVHELEYLH